MKAYSCSMQQTRFMLINIGNIPIGHAIEYP
ncbi:MAG: hypothetical protein ACI89W_001982 [Gammaproteobacteria bacterium]